MAEHPMTSDNDQSLEARITLALETSPEVRIPVNFASRVAGQLPPRPAVKLTRTRYGRNVAIVCMAVLLVLMLAFARHLSSSSLLWGSVEAILCAQFALLAFWLVARNLGPFIHWRL